MKKSYKKIIVVFIILLIILSLIVIIALINLNKGKKVISDSDFINYMEEHGYEVNDVTNKSKKNDDLVKSYTAIDNKTNLQVTYHELSDEKRAKTFYDNYISIFFVPTDKSSSNENINKNNYSKYILSTNDKYICISRVDNTIIYAQVESKDKDTIKTIFDDFSY